MKYAIVLPGGTGKRLGAACPKQFTEIAGRPVVTYVPEILEKSACGGYTASVCGVAADTFSLAVKRPPFACSADISPA